ncbi:MAG: hypothetical protein JWO31_3171, partial [Phycisphaerales bacterium]|nr:hypothetical protein [Phycisphaerales bacterium]
VGWALLAVRRVLDGAAAADAPGGAGGSAGAVRGFVLPGVLAGLACGVKLTGVPLLLLAVPAVACLALFLRAPRAAVLGPLVFGLAGALTFAPWLARNAAWTGNPVFPEGTAVFGKGHFDDEQVARWKHAHAAQPDQASPAARAAAFGRQVSGHWQYGFVLLPLAALTAVAAARAAAARVAAGRGRASDGLIGEATAPPVLGPGFLTGLLLVHVAFWAGFTHLQGRFFVLAVPVAGMLLATAGRCRPNTGRRLAAAAAGLVPAVVVLAAVFGWWNVHVRLAFKLYEDQGSGVAVALGTENIDWIVDNSLAGFPRDDPTARLLLVGDAQAFWYPLAGDRLSYRTVFDLSSAAGASLLDAFDPGRRRADGKTWLLVNPSELDRYAQTYQPFRPIPEAWRRHPAWSTGQAFLVPPGRADVP